MRSKCFRLVSKETKIKDPGLGVLPPLSLPALACSRPIFTARPKHAFTVKHHGNVVGILLSLAGGERCESSKLRLIVIEFYPLIEARVSLKFRRRH